MNQCVVVFPKFVHFLVRFQKYKGILNMTYCRNGMSEEGLEAKTQNKKAYIYICFKIFMDPCQISRVLPNGQN